METRELFIRGKSYLIACHPGPPEPHPSWFSFEDESNVRDRDWGIQPGDLVLDVGAAYGSYTLTALALGAAFVYAWSPQRPSGEHRECDVLRRSLVLNHWEDRCEIYENGVFDKIGWIDADAHAFSEEEPTNPTGTGVFPVETLDAWYERTEPERVNWMKLDVESAEVEVFRGAEKLIREMKPNILVEIHLFIRASIVDEVRELLVGQHGYREVSTHPHHAVSHSLYVP